MQALAKVASGSVTVLSHPSLQGIQSGSGISGSTAWHGAFRFRQFLTGVKAEAGEQPDSDLRQLEFKKNQYGRLGDTIVVRYQNGLFLPEDGISGLDKAAREARVDEVFLSGLSQIIRQGRDAMAGETSREFGPTLIAEMPEAKKERIRKKRPLKATAFTPGVNRTLPLTRPRTVLARRLDWLSPSGSTQASAGATFFEWGANIFATAYFPSSNRRPESSCAFRFTLTCAPSLMRRRAII